jgi:DNA-binding IclR family transcriptional regulator
MHKLMAVLDCFSRYDRSLTLNEISTRCGMPKTTVHRLVSSLREVKLLEQDRGRDRYRMGIRLFELGSIVLNNLDIYREARPLVERLISATGENSHLCVFDGTNMVSIEHVAPGAPGGSHVNWTTMLSISPAYCTGVGKAALAFQDKAVIDKIIKGGLLPYTPATITDPDLLKKELELTRRRGYSIDEGEHQFGVRCIAAPIYNSASRVFAAISVTGPKERITIERIPSLAALVTATAQELSRQLGYDGYEKGNEK